MGNRFSGGIAPGAMPWLHRYIGIPCSRRSAGCSSGARAGFPLRPPRLPHDRIRGLGLRTTGMEFASEMVVKATPGEARDQRGPDHAAPDGRSRPPHLRPWRDGWRHLRFLLLYSPRWLFLYPGIALSGWDRARRRTAPRPAARGSVGLDVNAFVCCAVASSSDTRRSRSRPWPGHSRLRRPVTAEQDHGADVPRLHARARAGTRLRTVPSGLGLSISPSRSGPESRWAARTSSTMRPAFRPTTLMLLGSRPCSPASSSACSASTDAEVNPRDERRGEATPTVSAVVLAYWEEPLVGAQRVRVARLERRRRRRRARRQRLHGRRRRPASRGRPASRWSVRARISASPVGAMPARQQHRGSSSL